MSTVANFICMTCGTQFAESQVPPFACAICQDERQYVKVAGQAWTTMVQVGKSYRNSIKFYERGLIGIGIDPHFAIGQRALLLLTPHGNVLWDCVPLLDQAVVECVKSLGGIKAIAISHPHYYSTLVEWSRAFSDAPVYLHAADRQWVMRPDACVEFWDEPSRDLVPGVTLIHCGGHFAGGAVLHWQGGADGKGALLTGDILQVVADRKHVSFMFSYPNYIPLSASAIEKIAEAIKPFPFDRVYGAFWDTIIETDGKAAVGRSRERYLRASRDEVSGSKMSDVGEVLPEV